MSLLASILGALLIGVSLGLLGAGGSILTVPVLVYLVGQPEKLAIAGSLGIVGAIAAAGALPWISKKLVHWRSVLWFGLPGMAGTVAGAWASVLVSGAVQLIVFAGVMLLASWFMLLPRAVSGNSVVIPTGDEPTAERAAWKIVSDGLAVGALTGFVGVGGGFLIVPALVLLGRLDMHRAVGTSLVIIALKSFAGFAKYLSVLEYEMDWGVLSLFTVIGIAGSLAGARISQKLPQVALKRGFGMLLIPMAIWILWRSWP